MRYSNYPWDSIILEGRTFIGMKGNLDTSHDAHAEVFNFGPHPDSLAEQEGNAKLIALAPQMYEALLELTKLGNGDVLGNSDGNMIARRVLQLLDVPKKGGSDE